MGGNEKFVEYLDWYFEKRFYGVKETRMHIPHLYTYAGRPDKAADRVRKSLDGAFRNAPDGLPDNEDMGCQSAYYLCNTMGIYPVYGQTHYLLVPPAFDRIEINYGKTGKMLRLTADRGISSGRYISSMTMNGKALDRAWISHKEIAGGGELHFVLSDTPNGFGKENLPPNGLAPQS
jgi:putative alpha-1,2-mannosidase